MIKDRGELETRIKQLQTACESAGLRDVQYVIDAKGVDVAVWILTEIESEDNRLGFVIRDDLVLFGDFDYNMLSGLSEAPYDVSDVPGLELLSVYEECVSTTLHREEIVWNRHQQQILSMWRVLQGIIASGIITASHQ